MDTASQVKILSLNSEIAELKHQLYLQEKKNRELEHEVQDYATREKQLLAEIDALQQQLELTDSGVRLGYKPIPTTSTTTVMDYLNPKSPFGLRTEETSPHKGLESEWADIMYAYTDEIFVDADTPDLLLYRDDHAQRYCSDNGNTFLNFPITQETLEYHNILKVRPLTDAELGDVTKRFS